MGEGEQSFCSRWSEIRKGRLGILRVSGSGGRFARGVLLSSDGAASGIYLLKTGSLDRLQGRRAQTALSTFREVGMEAGGSDFVQRLRLASPSL